jgi:hypothetical protein
MRSAHALKQARGSGSVSSQVAGSIVLRALWRWLVCGLVPASPLMYVCGFSLGGVAV